MKIPFFQDSRAKRNLLDNGEDLFEHCNKLLDETKINIANVKNDKYDINLDLDLSCDI